MRTHSAFLLLFAAMLLAASAAEALPAWLAAEPSYSLDIELASLQGVLPTSPHLLIGVRVARLTCSVGPGTSRNGPRRRLDSARWA